MLPSNTGGLLLAAAGLWAVSLANGSGADVVGRWVGLLVSGVVVFTLAASAPRPRSQTRRFWTRLAVLAVAHVVTFGCLMWYIETWRVAWWGIAIPVEWFLVTSVSRKDTTSQNIG